MANIVPFSFKGELMSGTHNFANGGDQFVMALYNGTISNTYTTSTTVVQTNDEVSSAGSSNYARKNLGSAGIVTAALAFGGEITAASAVTESWSGSTITTKTVSTD